jgi:hypothetical protein
LLQDAHLWLDEIISIYDPHPHTEMVAIMSSDNNNNPPEKDTPTVEEMKKYGIDCVPVDYFHYREFRYTSLRDAIAQAKRDERSHVTGSAS